MKRIALLIVLMMVLSSVDACSDQGGADGGVTQGDVPTLIWWVCGAEPEDLAEGNKAISDYIEDKIGARLEIRIAGWGEFGDRMNVAVNSSEYYDLMFTNDGSYNRYVSLGAFADITDMLKTASPQLWDFIPEDLWNGVLVNDRIYSVPTYKDSSMTQYWGFDSAHVEKYGLDVSGEIDTFPELDAAFRTIKAGEGESFYTLNMNNEGFNGLLIDYDSLSAGLPPLGVHVDDETRTVVSVLEQPDVMESLRLMHGWYMDGMINPDAAVVSEGPKPNHFLTGQGFPGAEIGWAMNSGIDSFTVFPVNGPIYTTGSIQGSLNAVYTNSNNKEKALQFLELANTDHKLRDMLAYGIEGKHFEYVSENVIKKLTDTWTLPGYQQATFFNMSTIEGSQADMWDQVKKLNEAAYSSQCLGFMINMEPINDELSNCRTIWDKYRAELQTGTSDPDVAVPALMAELKNNGFDKIMEEAQKQLNEYFG